MRRFFFVSLAGVLLFGIVRSILSAERTKKPPRNRRTPATYVGNEVCQACHALNSKNFPKPRWGKFFSLTRATKLKKELAKVATGLAAIMWQPAAVKESAG